MGWSIYPPNNLNRLKSGLFLKEIANQVFNLISPVAYPLPSDLYLHLR